MTAITGGMGTTATVPTPKVLRRGDFDRMEGGDRRRKVSHFRTALIHYSVVCLLCSSSLNLT